MTIKVCFIGFGNMARAIAEGLESNPQIKCYATSPALPCKNVITGISTHSDNTAFINEVDIVILSVKPSHINNVLADIKPLLSKEVILVSIVSGITLTTLANKCNEEQPIIRSMPNLPIAVEQGVTALVANNNVNQHQRIMVDELFSSCSMITWFDDETLINAFTALYGSGPAYVFYFLEAMTNIAEKMGISTSEAKSLTLHMFSGALQLAKQSSTSITTLRQNVTSPGGTTAAALEVLRQNDFELLLFNAINAASERASHLEKSTL